MLYLSDAALKYAISRCMERAGYKVGIASCNRHRTINDLVDMVDANVVYFVSQMRMSNVSNCYIRFVNGSEIRLISANENARGNKFHLVIVDEKIDNDIINNVIHPMEILEYMERHYRVNNKEFETH